MNYVPLCVWEQLSERVRRSYRSRDVKLDFILIVHTKGKEEEKELKMTAEKEKHHHHHHHSTKKKGLSVLGAISFIVGDIVGAGIVTLPYTMQLISWWGLPMFFFGSLLMCMCGCLLSKTCLAVFNDVANRETIRDPYPQVGERAYGNKMKNFVIVILNVSLFFACIVFLLLLGEIMTQVIQYPVDKISHRNQLRVWFAICGLFLLPFTFLGTPKDFWCVGPMASIASVLASILILLNVLMVGHRYGYTIPKKVEVDPEIALAISGTIQFTFGGISIFPTIQNDLEEPERFPQAVTVSYIIVFVIYTGVSVAAFVVLNGKIQEDILSTFIAMDLYRNCPYFRLYVTIAQVMICVHILGAFILILNPVNLQLESMLDIPICKYMFIDWLKIMSS